MDHCPVCGLLLEEANVEGHAVRGCGECGGVWVAASDLADLAKNRPAALGDIERRFSSTLLAGARTGRAPECGRCRQPLAERHFPAAPNLPLHACPTCKMIWLADGQCEQLQQAVAPASAAPAAGTADDPGSEVEPEAEPDDGPGLRDASGYGPLRLWPERIKGQPLLNWLICDMPLWLAVVPLLAGVALASVLPGAGWLLLITWPELCLGAWFVLLVTWSLLDTGPDMESGESLGVLARITACLHLLAGLLIASCVVVGADPSWGGIAAMAIDGLVFLGLAGFEPLDCILAMKTRAYWYF